MRGQASPLLLPMIRKSKIEELVADCLEGTDRFVVSVKVSPANQISVVIDGDSGVTIDHCVAVSRFVESSLDRDTEDFDLKVSTAGIDQPFVNLRQYRKNVGRPVEVLLKDGSVKRGKLCRVDEAYIEVEEEIVKKNKKLATGPVVRLPMDEISRTEGLIVL